jgi:hypothetical protein
LCNQIVDIEQKSVILTGIWPNKACQTGPVAYVSGFLAECFGFLTPTHCCDVFNLPRQYWIMSNVARGRMSITTIFACGKREDKKVVGPSKVMPGNAASAAAATSAQL